ncbi:hypothetical protein BJ912DRAFT_1062082 [Pholiota molesta]|nr:hypothetical protein BJ912DRAFT_1062082 [Pholiota molesta]
MNSKLDKYHAMLYELDGYVGREGFPLETTWMVGLNGDTLFDVMGSRELTCSIVGFVSSNNLKMEAHGNFIPHGPPSDKKTIKQLINAAMEFRLTRPPDRFKTFQEEFDNAIQNLYVVSKGISEDGKTSKLISYASNDSPELLFSKSIFCAHYGPKRTFTNDAEHLPVADTIRPYLIPLYGKYKACPIEATHLDTFTTRSRIDSDSLQSTMHGSLVEVRFLLYHEREDDEGLVAFITDLCVLDMPM